MDCDEPTGLSVGDDGAFLIDDQFAPLTEKIQAAVAAQTSEPVRFVVNTHWHGDHTGGNEEWGEMGALIVAHENVRERMSTEQFMATFGNTVPPSPEAALPVVTFTDEVTFYWNDEEIRVIHVDPAHTDGDAIIQFVNADVIHGGDALFNGFFPLIDVSSADASKGWSRQPMPCWPRPVGYAVIPRHGPVASRSDVQAYRDMLATAHERISALIAEGRSRDEVIAAKPMADFEEVWGGGFLPADQWVGIAYDATISED